MTLRHRFETSGCEVTDVVDHGFIRSICFNDPNGIALEASWWALDATGRHADYADNRLFGDPHPVTAVDALRRTGHVTAAPQTKLVDPAVDGDDGSCPDRRVAPGDVPEPRSPDARSRPGVIARGHQRRGPVGR